MRPSWYQAGLNPNDLFFHYSLWTLKHLTLAAYFKEGNKLNFNIFFAGVSGVLLCWPKET